MSVSASVHEKGLLRDPGFDSRAVGRLFKQKKQSLEEHSEPPARPHWRPAVGGKVCVYHLCMGFGVHTALINLHPVFGSVEDGFELCRMYGS